MADDKKKKPDPGDDVWEEVLPWYDDNYKRIEQEKKDREAKDKKKE